MRAFSLVPLSVLRVLHHESALFLYVACICEGPARMVCTSHAGTCACDTVCKLRCLLQQDV